MNDGFADLHTGKAAVLVKWQPSRNSEMI